MIHAHQNEKLLYTARTHTVGDRGHGTACSSDGYLDVKLSIPSSERPGTNPEQLLGGGWSACFEGAIARVARSQGIGLPAEPAIDAEIDLNNADDGFLLRVRLNVSLPGLECDVAQAIVEEAHSLPVLQGAQRQHRYCRQSDLRILGASDP